MEIKLSGKRIEFDKKLSALDELAIDFTRILGRSGIKSVLVSGYVSILFGRSRLSEDIDLIIRRIGLRKFCGLWDEICKEFECLNVAVPEEAYNDYLAAGHALRFSRKGSFIPNMEVKFPKTELEEWVLGERKEVLLNGAQRLFISPLELQISFKLSLGSEKDIEDARYLYKLFSGRLDMRLLQEFNQKLKVEGLFRRYLL